MSTSDIPNSTTRQVGVSFYTCDEKHFENFLWKGPKSIYSFRFKNMSKEDIETYLGSLPNKSNNDILGMALVLLRKSAPYISISLANVINNHAYL